MGRVRALLWRWARQERMLGRESACVFPNTLTDFDHHPNCFFFCFFFWSCVQQKEDMRRWRWEKGKEWRCSAIIQRYEEKQIQCRTKFIWPSYTSAFTGPTSDTKTSRLAFEIWAKKYQQTMFSVWTRYLKASVNAARSHRQKVEKCNKTNELLLISLNVLKTRCRYWTFLRFDEGDTQSRESGGPDAQLGYGWCTSGWGQWVCVESRRRLWSRLSGSEQHREIKLLPCS